MTSLLCDNVGMAFGGYASQARSLTSTLICLPGFLSALSGDFCWCQPLFTIVTKQGGRVWK